MQWPNEPCGFNMKLEFISVEYKFHLADTACNDCIEKVEWNVNESISISENHAPQRRTVPVTEPEVVSTISCGLAGDMTDDSPQAIADVCAADMYDDHPRKCSSLPDSSLPPADERMSKMTVEATEKNPRRDYTRLKLVEEKPEIGSSTIISESPYEEIIWSFWLPSPAIIRKRNWQFNS